jgi:hypothetical protein
VSGFANAFPSSEQMAELQRGGWSLVATTGEMAAIRKDESGVMLPWSKAWAQLQAERTEAKKARR